MKMLEKKIDYKFKDKKKLELALTHSSLMKNGMPLPDNERLEFLGDSILGMIISNYIFNQFTEYSEGELSLLKSFLIKKDSLAYLGNKFELKQHLKVAKKLNINNAILENTIEAIIGAIFLDSDFYNTEKIIISWFQKYFYKELNSKKIFKDPITSLKELSDKLYQKQVEYNLLSEIQEKNSTTFEIEVVLGNLKAKGKGNSKKKAKEIACSKLLDLIQ